jgi:hypothetical protein
MVRNWKFVEDIDPLGGPLRYHAETCEVCGRSFYCHDDSDHICRLCFERAVLEEVERVWRERQAGHVDA